jgi:hypothetical protein
MQSSFLIKNHAVANFDSYLLSMKKRRATVIPTHKDGAESPTLGGKSPLLERQKTSFAPQIKKVEVCGVIRGKMPAARDGHSAVLHGEQMIIFGGDRHRMPFSDTYSFDLLQQLQDKDFI